MRLLGTPLAGLVIVLMNVAARADDAPAVRNGSKGPVAVATYGGQIRPFLEHHCLACHRGDKAKGHLHLDRLRPDFVDALSREQWLKVQKRIRAGEMPPRSKPRPTDKEVRAIANWITGGVSAADAARRAEGRVVLRRLNRAEYQNTIHDLLGVNIDLTVLLPLDSSAHGFDNVGAALHFSSFLMERYLEAADKALSVAVANSPRPPLIKKRYSLKNTHVVKTATERVFRTIADTVVCFSSSPWNAIVLTGFYPPDRGSYRFRLCVSGVQSAGKPVTFRVDAGPMLMGTKNHLVSYFDAPADQPAVIEFTEHFEARSHIRISPYGLAPAQVVDKIGAANYKGPGLAVHWVEAEGPLYDSWPPASHRKLFGDLPQVSVRTPNGGNRLEMASKHPTADTERILSNFARRAFRRTVTKGDIKPFVALVRAKLAEKRSFEQAVRVGLTAVLMSPRFLFLDEKPGKLDDFALASRLSYFLWSTMPDEELLRLADNKKLAQPAMLRQQVERMLGDPRATALTENFVGQWLGLRDIDFTEPSHILYPEFDHMLKVSMVRETELFFTEVLKHDLSLTNFVSSDFTMLNGRLAKHYGIPGVDGWEFRKVKLPPDSHRGGVLTMASVLKVTANGTTTSPVLRGAWVLDRILGTPPPGPPADVPALEPDIRGATTIREQLAKHRQVAACAGCHAKIDPPGFALESFDVIGGWRQFYRTTGNGKPVIVDGRRMPYLNGKKVEPADEFRGQKFKDIDEFKRLLLKDKEQLARTLAEKLVTYATGAAPSIGDGTRIEAIVRRIREKDYGLRSLVHEIVQSELFRRK